MGFMKMLPISPGHSAYSEQMFKKKNSLYTGSK
jgi:hypothetical protein